MVADRAKYMVNLKEVKVGRSPPVDRVAQEDDFRRCVVPDHGAQNMRVMCDHFESGEIIMLKIVNLVQSIANLAPTSGLNDRLNPS